MPNLFMCGSADFEVAGTAEQVKDVMSDVDSGWSNINVVYVDDGVNCVVEFRLSEKVSGTFEFIKLSST